MAKPRVLFAIRNPEAARQPGLAKAIQVARALGASLELFHALTTLATNYQRQKEMSRAAFEAFAAKARIPRGSRHLIDSGPLFAIPHVARKLGADLVVMGALSRSGLKRVFVGNTAERVLEDLPCDVLVVKPAHSVPRVAAEPRGARLVAPQPLTPMPC